MNASRGANGTEGPIQGLRHFLLAGLLADLRKSRPDYVAAVDRIVRTPFENADEAERELREAHAKFGGPPIQPWERLIVHLADYEIKLDAVRRLNELIQKIEDSRTMFHLTTLLNVPLFAAVQSLDELARILARSAIISEECADGLEKRIATLRDDEALQKSRHQVAHPASHVGEEAWVWGIASAGHVEAAAVAVGTGHSFPERMVTLHTMSPADLEDWQQRSQHVFSVLRVMGGDILREVLECAKASPRT